MLVLNVWKQVPLWLALRLLHATLLATPVMLLVWLLLAWWLVRLDQLGDGPGLLVLLLDVLLYKRHAWLLVLQAV